MRDKQADQAAARVCFSASVSGKRLFLLRAEELPPEPPQVHGLQRRQPDERQENKLKGTETHMPPLFMKNHFENITYPHT